MKNLNVDLKVKIEPGRPIVETSSHLEARCFYRFSHIFAVERNFRILNSEFLTTMSFACVNFRCQRDRKEVNQYFCQQAICMSVSYFVRVSAGSLASLCQTNKSITCKFNSNNVSLCPKNKIALLLVMSPAVHLSLFVQYRSYVY